MSGPSTSLIIGLSGSGKTHVCNWMAEEGFLHLDGDVRGANGINLIGIRNEWDEFWERGNPGQLAMALRERAGRAKAAGALLSLPSTAVFTAERVAAAHAVGLSTVMLFGTPEHCIRAFLEREKKLALPMSEADWHRNNNRAVRQYQDPAFDGVRLDAFRTDGARWSREEILEMVVKRLRVSGSESV